MARYPYILKSDIMHAIKFRNMQKVANEDEIIVEPVRNMKESKIIGRSTFALYQENWYRYHLHS